MNNDDFRQLLIKKSTGLPGFRDIDSHIILRCPNCETNRDPNKHGHLYINKHKDGHPFDCKKCGISSTRLTVDLIDKLGITDATLKSFISVNFKVKLTHVINVDERNTKLDYEINKFHTKNDRFKLSKLEDRLLHKFTDDELITYRIVTNVSKFLKENNISKDRFSEKELYLIDSFDKHYVGFLSYFGNIISLRNMTGDPKLPRYVNFIVDKSIKRSYLYTPRLPLDLLTENPKIVASEGAIGTIAIHLNNRAYDNNNAMYVGAGSMGGFRRAIKNALSLTGYYGAEIHVYGDNENIVSRIKDFDVEPLVEILRGMGKDFKVMLFLNLSSKDFGDMRKPITIGKINISNLL